MEEIIKNLDIYAKGIWCPIAWTVFLVLIVLIMPKEKMNWLQIYITYGVIGLITWISNSIFGVFFDLVDFGDASVTGLAEMLTYTFIPSSLAVIFMNMYSKEKKAVLTVLFLVVSLFIEWTCHVSGFMEYKKWSLLFSVPIYFVIYYFFLPFHYHLFRNVN